jgi:hypothetical protein
MAQQKHKKAKEKDTLDLYRMAVTDKAIHIKAVIKKLYISTPRVKNLCLKYSPKELTF